MEETLISKLLWPLVRLLLGLAAGLLLATVLESLRWTRHLARFVAPVSGLAHFGPIASSAFALAFVSPASANAHLSSGYASGKVPMRELVLANLFNSLPAYLSHLPTIFLLLWPVLGFAAAIYVGITLMAAILRTTFTIFLGALLLRKPDKSDLIQSREESAPLCARLVAAFGKSWPRFCKRLMPLLLFTVPVYLAMFLGQEAGFFAWLEKWLAAHLAWLAFLPPQAMGIIVLQLLAELGATLGAAGAALQDAFLTPYEVVVAMLIGNVLSTPLRAIRHQLPAYCGFYRPALAIKLVLANHVLRAASMIIVIALYIYCHS